MEYKSIREMADEWGISKRRIQVLCFENRIEGAVRIGYLWAITANAKKPKDARIKSGKYRKKRVMMNDNQLMGGIIRCMEKLLNSFL